MCLITCLWEVFIFGHLIKFVVRIMSPRTESICAFIGVVRSSNKG